MKDGYVIKSNLCGAPNKGELSLINSYTRRELAEDEVYVFSVVLCDNEIDRDNEKFTVDALHKLAQLYVGKTGIIDHDAKSNNQTARVFSCCVEEIPEKTNKLGEKYCRLVARAYMPRCEKNSDFILSLDAGIKKEVSVGCSVANITCSVCGANMKTIGCKHIKGKSYNTENKKSQICYHILDNPTDAYEWSFVAVPAQKEAGVIKAFDINTKGGVNNMNEIIKKFESGEELTLNKSQSKEVWDFIEKLKAQADDGRIYREDLKREVVRLSSMVQPEIKCETMNSVTNKMSIEELKEFKKAFNTKVENIIPPKPQLISNTQEKVKSTNMDFQI